MHFFKCFKLVLFRPAAGLDLFVMVCLFPEPFVRHVTRYSQGIRSTPRLSRQSRSVSMICRGTVQTSSHIMTRGMNFWPIRSGAQSFRPLHRKKLWYVCAFTPLPRISLASRCVGVNTGSFSPGRALSLSWLFRCLRRRSASSVGALSAYHRIAARLTGAAAWPV